MTEEQAALGENGVGRLLTFSDGVFAIAVTLLVLNLREPAVSHGLLGALLKQWPAYLSYVLSFLIIGTIWAQHHRMFQLIRYTDHLFLMINVVFLMWVAALPFPTALLARYLESSAERPTAIAIYSGIFVIGALLGNVRWHYAAHNGLLGDEVDRAAVQAITVLLAVGPILYLVDFAISFISPLASIVLLFLAGVFYAVSPLGSRPAK
ncbi:MAG: TMEM175 family protein [Chloroflexota bacterium]